MADSAKDYSDLPERYATKDNFPEPHAAPNDTLEPVRKSEEKEVATAREDDAPEVIEASQRDTGESGSVPAQRRWKLRWILIAGAIVILALALGIGLGVGLPQSSDGDLEPLETPNNSTADTPGTQQYFSTRGAFNGTDIAITRLASLGGDGTLQYQTAYRNALLIYQHFTGELRWTQYIDPDIFYSTEDNIVAADAKSNTPIDVTVGFSGTNQSAIILHVFYINSDNLARERYIELGSSVWLDGDLNSLDHSVPDISNATLRVGRYTGQRDPAADNNTVSTLRACTQVFVSSAGTEFEGLRQCPGEDWTEQGTLWSDVDALSAPAYMGWTMPRDRVMYFAYFDTDGNVKLSWLDTSSSAKNTAEHPLNQWNAVSNFSIPDLEPSAGLAALTHGVLIGKSATNGSIVNLNVTLDAERSSFSPSWVFDAPKILPGSLLKATVSANRDQVVVWYQATGDDIIMAMGTLADGPMDPLASDLLLVRFWWFSRANHNHQQFEAVTTMKPADNH